MYKASKVQHTESCSPLAMSSLMLPRSKLQSNRSGSPRNMHGNCFPITVWGDMLTCSISVIKTVTCHRSLPSNRKAHWNHQSSTKFAGQTLDDNFHWFTWYTATAATGSCSLKTARTQTPSLPPNFFCSAITLHALTCCCCLTAAATSLWVLIVHFCFKETQSTGKQGKKNVLTPLRQNMPGS